VTAGLALPLLLLLAAEPATARQDWRLALEAAATLGLTQLQGVSQTSAGLRVAAGGQGVQAAYRGQPLELLWLVTFAATRASSDHGVEVRDVRLGLETRARRDRLTLGIGADLVYLWVVRVTPGGTLDGAGVGGRLLAGVDLLRFGQGALFLDGEASLVRLGWGTAAWRPGVQAALGARW
jgi:hypothetical protein